MARPGAAGRSGVSIVVRRPTLAQAAPGGRRAPPGTARHELSHQHRAAVQLRYRIGMRTPLPREVLPLQEAEHLSVPGHAGRAGGRAPACGRPRARSHDGRPATASGASFVIAATSKPYGCFSGALVAERQPKGRGRASKISGPILGIAAHSCCRGLACCWLDVLQATPARLPGRCVSPVWQRRRDSLGDDHLRGIRRLAAKHLIRPPRRELSGDQTGHKARLELHRQP